MSELLEAGADCRTSIDRYRNSLGLDASLLGNLDLEHAIGIPCFDRLSSCRIRQGEAARAPAGDALDVFEAVAFHVLPRQSLAANGQGAVLGRYFYVLELDSRHIRTYHEAVTFLLQVHQRRPSRGVGQGGLRCVGTSVEIRVNLAVPAIHEGPRLIVHKIHHFALLSDKTIYSLLDTQYWGACAPCKGAR